MDKLSCSKAWYCVDKVYVSRSSLVNHFVHSWDRLNFHVHCRNFHARHEIHVHRRNLHLYRLNLHVQISTSAAEIFTSKSPRLPSKSPRLPSEFLCRRRHFHVDSLNLHIHRNIYASEIFVANVDTDLCLLNFDRCKLVSWIWINFLKVNIVSAAG